MRVPFIDLWAMHAEIAEELDDVWRTITRQGAFIGGQHVEDFETQWARYCGVDHCVGVSNGTSALEFALEALGIGAGDEVIVPANTFIATAEAVVSVGAKPVFIDVDPSTLLMTASGVADAIGPRAAAVIAVHLYGQPVDMDALNEVARAAGIAVIEDAAQAHGATWRGRRVGSFSDAACFSFYPGKNLGAFGDAGAVVSSNAELVERIRSRSNHGRAEGAPHIHHLLGRNDRLDALQAGILSIKLKRLEIWNAARRRAAKLYEELLRDLPLQMVTVASGSISSYHIYVVRTAHRDKLRQRLAAAGIATGLHYPIPCHKQTAFDKGSDDTSRLSIAETAAEQVLSLPIFPHISEEQIHRIATVVRESLLKDGL